MRLCCCFVLLSIFSGLASGQECINGDREVSRSWEKPSSENHRWSYEGACEKARAEVERELGRGWVIESIRYEDLGRKTNTDHDWTSKRTWKCTHNVKAIFRACRIASIEQLASSGREVSFSTEETFVVQNPYYSEQNAAALDDLPDDVQNAISGDDSTQLTTTHSLEHAAQEKSPVPLAYMTTFQIASRGAKLEIQRRHPSDVQISNVEIIDKGRTTEFVQTISGGVETSYYYYRHVVEATYTASRNLQRVDGYVLGLEKSHTMTVTTDYTMQNPYAQDGGSDQAAQRN